MVVLVMVQSGSNRIYSWCRLVVVPSNGGGGNQKLLAGIFILLFYKVAVEFSL